MIESLADAIAAVERRERTLEVYAPDDATAGALAAQFASKTVSVNHRDRPADATRSFAVVRSADGTFLGALALENLEALLSPEVHPPWELAERETGYDEVFDFLDDTIFRSFDRRQMLATAREIEERAWRIGRGRLFAGFQNAAALASQLSVYERLAAVEGLSPSLFVSDEWAVEASPDLVVRSESTPEIGSVWFVVFDGGGSNLAACGLVAEERDPGRYYGFWTYDPATVSDLVGYLAATYSTEDSGPP